MSRRVEFNALLVNPNVSNNTDSLDAILRCGMMAVGEFLLRIRCDPSSLCHETSGLYSKVPGLTAFCPVVRLQVQVLMVASSPMHCDDSAFTEYFCAHAFSERLLATCLSIPFEAAT